MNNSGNGNRFFDGFLWGAIIGGGLVFLLGTKKGKKLLKTISEEGVEGLSELLEEQIDKEEDFENEVPEQVPQIKPSNGNGVVKQTQESVSVKKETKPARRFFRRKS